MIFESTQYAIGEPSMLEKLEAIDKRSLLIFLRNHKDEIPEKHMKLAKRRFKEDI